MVQVRKLALAVFAASTLGSGAAHALGMGEIRVESALYEPLRAEIQLRDLKGVSEQQIIVALAPDSAFEKAGIERSDLVSSLRFKPVFNGNSGYILVTSTKSMREPYLDFLINVKWPSGRVTRSFTVLLDPPNYTPATAYTAPREPEVSAAPAPGPSYQNYQQPQHPVYQPHYPPRTQVPPSYAYRASGASPQLGGTYRTRSTDTLWKIASAVAGRKSIYQTMLAIQDLNPDAFVGGNINRLRVGQVLHLPTHQQIVSRSAQESVAEAKEQAHSWKNPELGESQADQQLDARRHDKAATGAGGDASTDRLKVASGERGGSAGTQEGSGKGAGSGSDQSLADRLAAAQEELDVSRRQNEELSSRVDSLQDQIEKLTKVVQLRDERLAALQQGQGESSQAAPAQGQSAANQQPAAGSQTAAAGQANSAQPTSQPPVGQQPATVAAKPKSQPPHPVSQNVGSQSQSGISWLLWLVIALVVIAVLWLLMVMGRSAKRRSQSTAATERPQASLTKASHSSEPAMSSQPAVPAAPAAKAAPAAAAAAASAIPKPLVDPLKRADNLIRNKSFGQAVEVLQKAIKQDPQNDQLALKLLEAYAEKGDKDSFESYAKHFVNDGGDETQVEQLRAYYPGLFVESEPEPMPAARDNDFGQQQSLDDEDDVLLKAEESASAEPLEWKIDEPKEAEKSNKADKARQDDYEISLDENDMAGQSLEDLEKELADYPSIKDEPSRTADDVIDLSELEEAPASGKSTRQGGAAAGAAMGLEPAGEGAGEFDFMAGTDEVGTKLELAKAYIELGDADGAKDMLNEVLADGSDAQQKEARELLSKLD